MKVRKEIGGIASQGFIYRYPFLAEAARPSGPSDRDRYAVAEFQILRRPSYLYLLNCEVIIIRRAITISNPVRHCFLVSIQRPVAQMWIMLLNPQTW